ncbi:hypothetical protein ACFPN1_12185 [Lysobacter yangpyeongensis]|uniref:Phage integrase family protein n=1 Tax=Lysobacter yangpyeongensis TaxID=346182 RepID=A0ABW0SPA9_9GAMM
MPEKPWGEYKGAHSIATQIATEELGWIQPLPDEVAVPLLNRATWFLHTPASDLLELQAEMEAAYYRLPGRHPNGNGTSESAREHRQSKICKEWRFSVFEGDERSWHPPLAACATAPTQRALRLIKSLQSAAMLTIQGFTGLRVSELCGLPAGVDPHTGLPHCVECKLSASGLHEIFVLKTELSKTEETPRDTCWQIGLRPVGSEELPIPVRAIIILDELLAPYRRLINSKQLLVSLRASRGLPKTPSGVEKITRDRVLAMYKDFVEEWVDLSELPEESAHPTQSLDLKDWRESKGRILTTHQLRKTFALYVLSVDPRLLPAIKRQFQHVSLAMTESGYWGGNPNQVEPVHSVSAQQTALIMYELATGRKKIAGQASERLEVGASQLKKLVEGLSLEQGWRKAVRWVRDNDIHSGFSFYGGCLPLATSEMECWKRTGAKPLGHQNPNYLTRDQGVCSGCRCFWMDARHVPKWEQRYVENETAFRLAESRGDTASFRRIRERARQAAALLRSIDFDLSSAEQKIKEELVRGNAI